MVTMEMTAEEEAEFRERVRAEVLAELEDAGAPEEIAPVLADEIVATVVDELEEAPGGEPDGGSDPTPPAPTDEGTPPEPPGADSGELPPGTPDADEMAGPLDELAEDLAAGDTVPSSAHPYFRRFDGEPVQVPAAVHPYFGGDRA